MILTLTTDQSDDRVTLGILEAEGRKWHTLEPPWRADPQGGLGGQPHCSCIPAGEYRVEARRTEARGDHWLLSNPALDVFGEEEAVPSTKATSARSLVLLQAGNRVTCLRDGIAVGKSRERSRAGWQLCRSRDAMNELKHALMGKYAISLIVVRL